MVSSFYVLNAFTLVIMPYFKYNKVRLYRNKCLEPRPRYQALPSSKSLPYLLQLLIFLKEIAHYKYNWCFLTASLTFYGSFFLLLGLPRDNHQPKFGYHSHVFLHYCNTIIQSCLAYFQIFHKWYHTVFILQ